MLCPLYDMKYSMDLLVGFNYNTCAFKSVHTNDQRLRECYDAYELAFVISRHRIEIGYVIEVGDFCWG